MTIVPFCERGLCRHRHTVGMFQRRRQKEIWFNKVVDSATKFAPDFREHTIDTDMFTPQTIQRFTSHDNGAVYGATRKWFDGTTNFKNLFLCGTDQGFVGIVGSIISGISMANHHLLRGN